MTASSPLRARWSVAAIAWSSALYAALCAVPLPASALPAEGECPTLGGRPGQDVVEDATPVKIREGMVLSYSDLVLLRELIPAEIWRRNPKEVSKLLLTPRTIRSITLDPHRETADVDTTNNHWPRKPEESRFKLFKEKIVK